MKNKKKEKKRITKTESNRTKKKWPNLDPQFNLKTRQEALDFDYVHKLSDEEKDYLNKFAGEFINASFEKEPPKKKGKRRKLKNLHKTEKLRKSCYDSNNARNRDIISRAKASGQFCYLEDIINNEEDLNFYLQKPLDGSEDGTEG